MSNQIKNTEFFIPDSTPLQMALRLFDFAKTCKAELDPEFIPSRATISSMSEDALFDLIDDLLDEISRSKLSVQGMYFGLCMESKSYKWLESKKQADDDEDDEDY